MQKWILPFLLMLAACGTKQSDKKIQTTDHLVSIEGIGPIKPNMIQEDLEKLLNKKILMTNPTDTVSWDDSAFVQYKEADLKLDFVRTDVNEDSFQMWTTRITTSSPLCKTQNGIGVGSSKQQVIDAYPNYLVIIKPTYDNDTATTKRKTGYAIKIREDREGGQMVFHIRNNKVYSIVVDSYYDDSE